tara:strand:- start:288 stop:596 length:309 start_codon:yes stop_codon:yes gene_type:complete
MNKFIRDIIPLLFLMLVYIILFLDQKNNPYNRILKLDLNKSKNSFSSNKNSPNDNIVFKTKSRSEKEEEEMKLKAEKEEEKRIKALGEIKISPTWLRFTRII